MPIEGLSDQRELPRGGTLRLGDERSTNRPGRQLGYFRFDPTDVGLLEPFRQLYGAEPRAVVVAFHSDDREEVFSDYYRLWKGQRVWCFGDNRRAWRLANLQTGERQEVACTASCPLRKTPDASRNKEEGRDCQPEGWLRILLPELPTMQVFDVTCRTVSIKWVSTMLDLVQQRWGRLSGIPLVLSLREFKVRGMTNWGPCLDVRESLIAQALGGDPGRSLLSPGPGQQSGTMAPAQGPPTPCDGESPEPEGGTAAPGQDCGDGRVAPAPTGPPNGAGGPGPARQPGTPPGTNGHGGRSGSPSSNGHGRQSAPPASGRSSAPNGHGRQSAPPVSGRSPHFTQAQRDTIRQVLAGQEFGQEARARWMERARKIDSPQGASHLVRQLQAEQAILACRWLSPGEREEVLRALEHADDTQLAAVPRRLAAVRSRPDAQALLESLAAQST